MRFPAILRWAGLSLVGAGALAAMGFGGGPADRAIAEAERQDRKAAAGAPAGAAFTLNGVTVDGVSVYDRAELAPLYADYLAREVTVADLAAIAQAITDRYRADGYFLARAVTPRQTDAAGLARLVVYEGQVDEVAFDGDASPAVGALFSDITRFRPLKLRELDRRLALANDLPGTKVAARFEPDLDDPSRHRLVITTTLDRFEGQIYADNRGGEHAGPWQVYTRGALNSAVRSGDQLAVGLLTTPADVAEFSQADIAYSYPLLTGGSLRIGAAASEARDGADGIAAALGNRSVSASVRISHPLVRSQRRSLWVTGALEARRSEQDWAAAQLVDEVAVARASTQGHMALAKGYVSGTAQVSRGLGGFGGDPRDGRSRADADATFWKVNLSSAFYHDLGDKAGVYLAANGQWSPDALLASEEFAAGGLPVGRAYDYAEIMGDKGLSGLAEFRVGWDPNLRPLTFFQTYAFIDGAKVWNDGAPAGWSSAALASAGAGLRLVFGDRITVRAEGAKPLTRKPFYRTDKDWRGFVSVSSTF